MGRIVALIVVPIQFATHATERACMARSVMWFSREKSGRVSCGHWDPLYIQKREPQYLDFPAT